MTYVENNLLVDEKIIYFTRMHKIVFLTPILLFLAGILLVVFAPHFFPESINSLLIPLPLPAALQFIPLPPSINLFQTAIAICFILAIYLGIDTFISYKTSEFAITNKRVVIKQGWLHVNSFELFLDKIEGIHNDQSIPGRIFGYGSLQIVGTGGTQDSFFYVPNPLLFRRIAQEQVDHAIHPHIS